MWQLRFITDKSSDSSFGNAWRRNTQLKCLETNKWPEVGVITSQI